MKLFVPVVGSKLKLLNNTDVTLKYAGQNTRFIEKMMGDELPLKNKTITLTLPAGMLLVVDRVYIRQGNGADFNSLTFKVDACEKSGIPKGRFFLSVDEVNTLDVDIVTAKPEKHSAKNARSLMECIFDNTPVIERSNGRVLQLFFDEVAKVQPMVSGQLMCNLKFEYERFLDDVEKHRKKNDLPSIQAMSETLCEKLCAEDREKVVYWCKQINNARTFLDGTLSDKEYVTLYSFSVKQIGEEPAIILRKPSLNPDLQTFFTLIAMMDSVVGAWCKVERPNVMMVDTLYRKTLKSLMLDRFSETDSFGYYFYKNNHTPRSLIVNKDKSQACLPMDVFGENLFTRTKNAGLGHDFIYQTDEGTMLTPAQLRKIIK